MDYLFAISTLAVMLLLSLLTYRLGRQDGMLESLRIFNEVLRTLNEGLSSHEPPPKEVEERERY